MRCSKKIILILIGLFALIALLGCEGSITSKNDVSSTSIAFEWPVEKSNTSVRHTTRGTIPEDVDQITLQVTASDISTIQTSVDLDTGEVILEVPDGSNRIFQVWGYPPDSSTPNYYGTTTVDISGDTTVVIQMSREVPSDTSAPTTPTGLAVTAVSTSQIDLSWEASTDDVGVTGYNVYRDGSFLTSTTSTSTSDTGLISQTEYCYTVTAYDAFGNESEESNEVCAITSSEVVPDTSAPTIPTGLTATAVSSTQIDLSWEASTDDVGVTGYNVYRDGSFLTSVTSTSINDTDLDSATEYCYTITAYDAEENEAEESDEVCLIIGYPDTLIDTVNVGDVPGGIAVTPDGNYIYVANFNDDTVSVIQTSDNTVTDTVAVGDAPYDGVVVTPDGNYVYVANRGDDTVSVIQTSDNTVIDTIAVGSVPGGIAVTPDGNYVYVPNFSDNTVSVIQTLDNTVIDTIAVGNGPLGVAVTPDGNYVYVTNYNDDTVSVIQTLDNTVIDTIAVGDRPNGMAFTPDGNYVYVANRNDDTVSVIQTSDNTETDTIAVDGPYDGVAVTPDGNYVYVINRDLDTVSVIQTSDNTVIDSIAVGNNPFGIAVTPNGNYIYVSNWDDDTVSVLGF